jgi:hypothetical protein
MMFLRSQASCQGFARAFLHGAARLTGYEEQD